MENIKMMIEFQCITKESSRNFKELTSEKLSHGVVQRNWLAHCVDVTQDHSARD